MSIFATNWIVDEETGEAKLVKHLNKIRVDRYTPHRVGGWNKSGVKARIRKRGTHYGKIFRSIDPLKTEIILTEKRGFFLNKVN